MKPPIYLDYNSTTPVDQVVLETILPYFNKKYGNAGSRTHPFGWDAEEAVEEGRENIAKLIGADQKEIVFTSGATESVNLALTGIIKDDKYQGNHIITVSTEHKAVLDTCKYLESRGAKITYLPVDEKGLINTSQLEESIRADTILISVIYANNETGVIQPMEEISKIADKHNIPLMSDATQAIGKMQVDVVETGIDLMAFSAHKMYGPKGIGALYIKKKKSKITLTPSIYGGSHEKGIRSGTLNVTGIVGFGKASEICLENMQTDSTRIMDLRNRLEAGLLRLPGTQINGSIENRLPNTSNIAFKNIEATMLIESINKEIAIATGSACTSASQAPSHVLKGMGLSPERIHSSVRFSLGKYNTEAEIDYVIEKIQNTIATLLK